MCTVLYTGTYRRRPVWIGRWPQPDAQGAIPAGWCEECGAEVFADRERLCRRCAEVRKEREEDEDQSLFDLFPGGGSGKL